MDRCSKSRQTSHGSIIPHAQNTVQAGKERCNSCIREMFVLERVPRPRRTTRGIFAPQSVRITRRCSLSPGVSFLAPRVAPSARSDVLRIRRSTSSTSAAPEPDEPQFVGRGNTVRSDFRPGGKPHPNPAAFCSMSLKNGRELGISLFGIESPPHFRSTNVRSLCPAQNVKMGKIIDHGFHGSHG